MRIITAASLTTLLLAGCGGAEVVPTTVDTFAYSEGGNQRVACCTSRARQRESGASVEYALVGVPWWSDGTWHDGASGPIPCITPGGRTPVRIGYVETAVTDDAPGTTLIAWLRCERSSQGG